MGPELAGLEAMLVGAGAHLQAQDCVVLERNRLIASLVRGTPLNAIFGELRNFSTGNSSDSKKKPSRTEGASALKITMDAVLAQAEEMKSQRGITVMFCTEHPVTLAGQQDALAIAAERKLPIVCLLENSAEWEASATLAAGSAEKTIANEQAFYPRLAVDGNDLVAIFRVSQEATRRAREGHGPALIDCRFSDAIRVAVDPIQFMKQYLQRRKLWSDAWARKVAGDFNREMKESLASADEQIVAGSQLNHIYSLDRTRQ
jgi:TPP-dependent pyruvate/acetoin dehydrogenase alpha subunit